MLAMIARRVPVMATFSASLVDSCAWPFSILTSMSADLAIDSVPFGPLTLTLSRSEEHTSELQSLMHNSYDVFFMKKKMNLQTTCNILQLVNGLDQLIQFHL